MMITIMYNLLILYKFFLIIYKKYKESLNLLYLLNNKYISFYKIYST